MAISMSTRRRLVTRGGGRVTNGGYFFPTLWEESLGSLECSLAYEFLAPACFLPEAKGLER